MPSSSCTTGWMGRGIHHAFGGAFALLWCTGEPRTTVDIDLNIFAPPSETHSRFSTPCPKRSWPPMMMRRN
jgi:hypothetical protein